MAKQKNAPLSSPGLDAVDTSTSDKPKRKPNNRGCGCLIFIVVMGVIFAAAGASKKPPTPTPAAALAATDAPRTTTTVTPYPDITMTATQPATFEEEEASLEELPGVISVERIERQGADYWAIVTTHPKFNSEFFAGLLQTQAIKVDIYTFRFAVRIDDKGSEPLWWIYNEKFEWSSSQNPPAWVDLSPKEEGTATRKPAATARPTIKAQSASGGQSVTPMQSAPKVWDCTGDHYNCDSFGSRADMRSYFEQCPGDPSNLDGNADGQYCESN